VQSRNELACGAGPFGFAVAGAGAGADLVGGEHVSPLAFVAPLAELFHLVVGVTPRHNSGDFCEKFIEALVALEAVEPADTAIGRGNVSI
jgi:hypothetical protein